MATHKQAIKRHRQSEKKNTRNRSVKSAMKTRVKNATKALESKDVKSAEAAFKEAQSFLADAGRKKVVHHRTTSRKTSRLAKRLNALKAAAK